MVTYKRVSDRVYVESPYASDLKKARIAFITRSGITEESIDPIARISDGCFALLPELDKPEDFLVSAPGAIDKIARDHRVVFFNRRGGIRTDYRLRASGLGSSVNNGLVSVGSMKTGNNDTPTGTDGFKISIIDGRLSADSTSLVIVFSPQGALESGLILKGKDKPISFPGDEQKISLTLTGDDRGLWRIPAIVDRDILDSLGVGPRYFTIGPRNRPIHHQFPLFAFSPGQKERFLFELDCAAPFDVDFGRIRSRVRLPDVALPTNFHSIHGHRLFLKASPQNTEELSVLALLKAPILLGATGSDKISVEKLGHHFVPLGIFRLHIANTSLSSVRMALGASNLESIKINVGDGGDLLDFRLGPALVRNRQGNSLLKSISPAERDTLFSDFWGLCRTAWLQVKPVSGVALENSLSVDPEGMQAYRRNDDDGLMVYDPTMLTMPNEPIPAVPILGLGSLDNHGSLELEIERQYLSRGRQMSALFHRFHGASVTASIQEPELRTPQGYAVLRTNTNHMGAITFCKTAARNPIAPRVGDRTDFSLVPSPNGEGGRILVELFSHNRLFLITKLTKLKDHFDVNALSRIYMADWRVGVFDETNKFNPYIILKHDNRSIEQLIDDDEQWNNVLPELRLEAEEIKAIKDKIEAVKNSPTDDILYGPLKRRLKDPFWSGLLLFDLELREMPPQLGAIEALLTENLKVHHIGIDFSAIQLNASEQWNSSIFGLIHFKNDARDQGWKPETQTDPLYLKLNELKLLVDNDAIKQFTCKIELDVREFLFTGLRKPASNLILTGIFESRVTVQSQRRDSYLFRAEPGIDFDFDNDYFLSQVGIRNVSLITEIEGGEKFGKLLISGWLSFNKLEDNIDILGINRLEFSDFGIRFGPFGNFRLWPDYPGLQFNFNGFNRRSDSNDENVRGESFLSKLPLKLRGFRINPSGTFSLSEIGYLDFSGITGLTIVNTFQMAFDFDLELGSLGALAKKLERFKLKILLGWVPLRKNDPGVLPKLAFGFRLDSGEGVGGIDFGIEGIIRLTADRFRLSTAVVDRRNLVIIAASNAKLQLFSEKIPQKNQDLSFYLFSNLKNESPNAEKIGWYARFRNENKGIRLLAGTGDSPSGQRYDCEHDQSRIVRIMNEDSSSSIVIDELALGQRIDLKLDEIITTRETINWLRKHDPFGSDKDFIEYAGSANSSLTYNPDREWFVAMSGKFFGLAEVQLLFRDPDLYGVYFSLLGKESLSADLLYQKISDGVGRYVGEFMPPSAFRNIDLGAFALTLGAIRMELYTDGGFLVDLGFPQHNDYNRSFVVQGGPFIGKGGFYIGRVPREALPRIPNRAIRKAFRAGFALRIGLGREVEKGPIRASLSVSVFGRLEGAIASLIPDRTGFEVADPAGTQGYCIYLQGEVGIIIELEGRVNLKLVQARLLLRAWAAVGITLETSKPVILHCEVGVSVSLVIVIGRIRIFGKTIKISISLEYSTVLRYEWVLPLRSSSTLVGMAVAESLHSPLGLPDFKKLGVNAIPLDLKLLFDVSRSIDDGVHAVLVPSIFLLEASVNDPRSSPLTALGEAFILWAVHRIAPDKERQDVKLYRRKELGITIECLRQVLASFDQIPATELEAFFEQMFGGSTIQIACSDSSDAVAEKAFAFPLPPGLRLKVGDKVYDFSQRGTITGNEITRIAAELNCQFTQQTPPDDPAVPLADEPRPMVEFLFRNWCELFAQTTLDELQNIWTDSQDADDHIHLNDLLGRVNWTTIAGRSGRLYHGGIRIAKGTKSESLLNHGGILLPVPDETVSIMIDGVTGSPWLSAKAGELTLIGDNARKIAEANPDILCQFAFPPATIRRPRSFAQPDLVKVADLDSGTEIALLNEFSTDFQLQLHYNRKQAAFSSFDYLARRANTKPVQRFDEDLLSQPPNLALVFDMVVDRVPSTRNQAANGAKFEYVPGCLQVSGASEAERRPIDALFAVDEQAGEDENTIDERLKGARIYFAIRGDNGTLLNVIEAERSGALLVRSTVSVERRPGPSVLTKARTALDQEYISDAKNPSLFLRLLQRAAIVNSGGTFILLPEDSTLFKRIEESELASLVVLVVFDKPEALPTNAVNSVFITDQNDRNKLTEFEDSHLAIRARAGGNPDVRDAMFETVTLREPGTILIRVWRKGARDKNASSMQDAPTSANCEEHVKALFDMLEFGVERDGKVLLSMERSVPVSSEVAVPENATEFQREDLIKGIPNGVQQTRDFRYDVLVPIWRFHSVDQAEKLPDNPYLAIKNDLKYTIKLGWRDIYGNRLGKVAETIRDVAILYQDPIVPLSAWPGVQAWMSVGTTPNTLDAKFAFSPTDFHGQEERRKIWIRTLQKVIHQFEGPGVDIGFRSKLGEVGKTSGIKAELIARLKAFLGSPENPPDPLNIPLAVTPNQSKAHLEIDLEFEISRQAELVLSPAPEDFGKMNVSLSLLPQNATMDDINDSTEMVTSRIATEFHRSFEGYWAALGTTDEGTSSWWAVDERLFPKREGDAVMYAQPPLARAPMSMDNIPYSIVDGNGVETTKTVYRLDLDTDAVFAEFLAKIDLFLSPPLSALTSRVPVSNGLNFTPFVRILMCKERMLSDDQLLRYVQPVYANRPNLFPRAAKRAMREACASELARFYEVASVVVQPLKFASDVPESWFEKQEEFAPKLYGTIRFGNSEVGTDSALNTSRALTYGIPISGRETTLTITVLIPSGNGTEGKFENVINLTADVAFQVTHVERQVDANNKLAHTPSRWLNIVPIIDHAAGSLPVIKVSDGKNNVIAPAPLRRIPTAPQLGNPELSSNFVSPFPAEYQEAVKNARRWKYEFNLGGVEKPHDEGCCRLIYNEGFGKTPLPVIQSAALPLFKNPDFLPSLFSFDTTMREGLWNEIASTINSADLSITKNPAFVRACNVFATLVEEVTNGLVDPSNLAFEEDRGPLEDRFIVSRNNSQVVTIRFADHLLESHQGEDDSRPPVAGVDALMISLAVEGYKPHPPARLDENLTVSFTLKAIEGKDEGPMRIGIEGLDAMKLQSVWPAASIRRNALIDNKKVSSLFVYRTAEVYLQEALVPNLRVLQTIPMGTRPAETLEKRLTAALEPLLYATEGNVSLQLRLGLEPIRLREIIETAFPAAADNGLGEKIALTPEPDPKIQQVDMVEHVEYRDINSISARLAERLRLIFQDEPIGDPGNLNLILSVVIKTSVDHHPLLRIDRLQIPYT